MFKCERTLVATVSTGWFTLRQVGEVEIDNGLERLGRSAGAQAIRQCCEPVGVRRLQVQQLLNRVTPTLRPTAAIGRAARSGGHIDWRRHPVGAMAGLSLGVAQRLLASGSTSSRHACSPLCNALQWDGRGNTSKRSLEAAYRRVWAHGTLPSLV